MTKIDRGPEPASGGMWHSADCVQPQLVLYGWDGESHYVAYSYCDADGYARANLKAICYRNNNWHAICDRAEAAEARVAELERELVRQGGVLRDAVSIAEEKVALAASYREALEGMAELVRSRLRGCIDFKCAEDPCCCCQTINDDADAIAAHVAEVLR